MKTDDLIRTLATGFDATGATGRRAAGRRLAIAVAAAIALSVPLVLALFGLNPSLAAAAATPMWWVKWAFVVAVLGGAGWLSARLARPGVGAGPARYALLLPVLVLWTLALVALATATPAQREPLLLGSTWRACPWNIALLSVPAFACVFYAMRGLAPTRLRSAGAAAGLLAGAAGACVYALHCPELTAPFIGVWYVLGMAIPAAAGAVVGPRLLRW